MSKINIVVVPNVEQIAREMTGSSQIAIILRRVFQLNLAGMFWFGINNINYALQILKKDFAAGIKVLCELEILRLSDTNGRCFVLHNQMVDMAIALKNKRIITYFFGLANKYHFRPALLTYNPELLIELLGDIWIIPNDLVIYTRIVPGSALSRYVSTAPIKFEDWRK